MRVIIILLFLFINKVIYSQVYNYLPISQTNIETNPSFVASENNKFIITGAYINNFQQNEAFSLKTIRISKYFNNYFSGIGLILSNTSTKDTIKYKHIGLSVGYRNILFDKIYVKLGINYKLINLISPKGYFTKYDFVFEDSIQKKNILQNMNFALSFSSSKELFYASFGFLNITPNWAKNQPNIFPQYSYLKIGNFWNFFDGYTDKELSLLFVNENYSFEKHKLGSYITYYNIINLSRNFNLKYGGDFGYVNNNYFNLKPSILFSKNIAFIPYRKGKNEHLIFKISADFAFNTTLTTQIYKPAYLFNLMYKL